MKKKRMHLVLSLIGPVAIIILLTMPIGPLAGGLGILQPIGGIFDVGLGLNETSAETIRIDGIRNEVTILIDHYGVPHIYAQSSEDAYFALGYMHAKDRLFQMVMQKYLAAGRLSELVGAAGTSSDKIYRTIGLERTARKTLNWFLENADTNPDVDYALRVMDAQVKGINAFTESMTSATKPVEFHLLGITPEPWSKVDMFLGASFITWSLTGDFDDLERLWLRDNINNDTMYEELYPDVMPYQSYIVKEQTNLSLSDYPDAPGGYPVNHSINSQAENEDAPEIEMKKLENLLGQLLPVVDPLGMKDTFGSNNWAVSGNRTATASPMLCNDAHMPIVAPNLVYEAHLSVPGVMNVMGVTLPGMPSVEAGFNDHIAWGFTNGGMDVLDIFVEQVNPENSSEYFYNGEYRPFEIIEETIHSSNGSDITFEVKTSVHGPLIDSVVSEDDDSPACLAMNWTGNGISHLIIAATKLNKAQNIEDYYDAIYWWDNPVFNFAYADAAGNIAMTVAGRIPIRNGYSGMFPVTALNDSVGMVSNVPYAFLPREVNPSRGYISSANQRSIDPDEYGYTLIGPYVDGYRGRRINELLADDYEVTMEDLMRFQADAIEIRARSMVPEVLSAWEKLGGDNATIEMVIDWFEDWNYEMDTELEAPTIWMHLYDALRTETFDELHFLNEELVGSTEKSVALPSSIYPRAPILEELILENASAYFDDTRTPSLTETRNHILVRALRLAVDDMYSLYGSDTSNWTYGIHHTVNVEHLAGLITIEGGPIRGQHTLFPAYGWEMSSGPVLRHVIDLENPQNSRNVIPGGQSGNPFSHHFDDLFQLWYTFDEESHHYLYQEIYFYSNSQAFRTADTEEDLIEKRINLIPRLYVN
ncbi:MAG: penicillin acylase family protein [Promethearchaeia archaeon]